MSLKDWFKKKAKKQNNLTIADYINGYYPSYSQFGSDIYASDVVQQAIFSIVNELKKLDPVHIRKSKGLDVQVSGNIQNVLDNPNPLVVFPCGSISITRTFLPVPTNILAIYIIKSVLS